jgi:hypothetical protein
VRFTTQPFGLRYRNGVRVTVLDATGDGIDDIIAQGSPAVASLTRVIPGPVGTP